MTLTARLIALGACSEAIRFARAYKTLPAAWEARRRPSMCLSKVTRLPSPESLLEEVVGWKVFYTNPRRPPLYTQLPALGLAHIRPPAAVDVGQAQYPTGFHIFAERSHAELFRQAFLDPGSLVVERVRGRGILAEGYNVWWGGITWEGLNCPVRVCLELMLDEEV